MTITAPPTYPVECHVGPTHDLVNAAFHRDGTINDQDAYTRLNAILDAAAFIGPVVEVA